MTPRAHRTRNIALFCALCTGVCLFFYGKGFDPLLESELDLNDVLLHSGRQIGPDPRLVFLGIDQPTYLDKVSAEEASQLPLLAKLTNSFPWSRDVWAAAVERLAAAGAKVILIDLIFAAPGPGDEQLRAALDRYSSNVVIGANLLSTITEDGTNETTLLPSESVLNAPDVSQIWSDPRVGFVNFQTDIDHLVRRATFRVVGRYGLPPKGEMRSLAARALEKFGATNLIPNDEEAHLFRYSAPPGKGYKLISFYEIFLPGHWTNNFRNGEVFRDKIVIIGPAANIFHDEHQTPYREFAMLGPEIHLNVIGAALRGEFLGESSFRLNLGLIAMMGFLAFGFALLIKGPIRRLFVVVVASAAYLGLCWVTFNYANFVLLAVTPFVALGSSTLCCFTYDFVLLRIEKNRTRRALERYVSKDVVREVLDNPETYLNTLGGVRKPVTILFSDVRGFTTMTEASDEGRLVSQVNEYFNEMVRIVFSEHGSLDKFIGDAVMALWGSITSRGIERDAQHAVAAALAMRKALARLNVHWTQRGLESWSFGIGVNHGMPIVGNIGSEQKMEVSVIGDAVNLASRLEGLTKEYKLDLLLGESMVPLVHRRFVLRTVDSVQVKGKTKPVRVFTVVADKEAGEQPPAWLARYEQGIELYRHRQFNEAHDAFAECLRAQPDDFLSELYLQRCKDLIAHPPGADWDTVFVMKSK
jgi:adenylate cyclase